MKPVTHKKSKAVLAALLLVIIVAPYLSGCAASVKAYDRNAYPFDTSRVATVRIEMLDKDWEQLPKMLPLGKRNIFLIPLILLSSSFMYAFDKHAVLIDAKQKISQVVNFKPIIFSKGDNLERIFLEY